MLRILFLFLFVCMWFNGLAQNSGLKEIGNSYICIKSKESSKRNFVVSNYMLYNQNVDKKRIDSTLMSLLTCELIEYNQNAVGGKHALLSIDYKDTVQWKVNKHGINYFFSCITKDKKNNNLNMIKMKVPIELSLSISYEIKGNIKYKKKRIYDAWGKDYFVTVNFVKEQLVSSYLYEDLSSILKEYNLRIRDLYVTDPILSYSRKRFIQIYPQYSKIRLPKEIIGLYVIFYVEKISYPTLQQGSHPVVKDSQQNG